MRVEQEHSYDQQVEFAARKKEDYKQDLQKQIYDKK